MLKKCFLIFVVSLLLPNSIVHAQDYQLSPESKKFIAASAVAGAVAGGSFGFLIGLDEYNRQSKKNDSTLWEEIKAFPWKCVAIPALLGAVLGGGISYFFTAESYLGSAENDLIMLENNSVLKTAMYADNSDEIKKHFFFSKFPTIRVHDRLRSLYSTVSQIKEYFIRVIQSGIKPLVAIAEHGLVRLERIEQKIVDWMARIKDDPKYLNELHLQSVIAHQQHIENLHFQMVRMQQQAAWVQATRPSYPPVVIIKNK